MSRWERSLGTSEAAAGGDRRRSLDVSESTRRRRPRGAPGGLPAICWTPGPARHELAFLSEL